MIKIGVRDFAEFMISGPARQRSILKRIKYPDHGSRLFFLYYADARRILREYHFQKKSKDWLELKGRRFLSLSMTGSDGKNTQNKNIARVLLDYHRHFADKKYDVLESIGLKYEHGEVIIKVTPDLHVNERKSEKILKFEFAKKPMNPDMVKTISQIMYESCELGGLHLSSSNILYLDISRGLAIKGARVGSRRVADIEATCDTITDIWPKILP